MLGTYLLKQFTDCRGVVTSINQTAGTTDVELADGEIMKARLNSAVEIEDGDDVTIGLADDGCGYQVTHNHYLER